jgi:hypothetical protein
MAYASKRVNILGFLAKVESSYLGGGAPDPAVDGIWPQFSDRSGIPATLKYTYGGDMGPAPGSLGVVRRGIPFGATVSVDIPFYFRGPTVAYSASVASALRTLWKACGLDLTVDTTSAAEKETYAPSVESTTPTSLSVYLYTDGELIPILGALCSWKFSGDSTGMVKHTFTIMGVKGTVADAASSVPAGITYPLATVQTPQFNGSTINVGSYTIAGLKSIDFDLGRTMEERVGLETAAGSLGQTARGRKPRLSVVVEKTALVGSPYHTAGGLDPYKLFEASNAFASTFQHGGPQYNRWKLVCPQMTLANVPERQAVNGVACVKLDLEPHVSTPVANDDFSVVCD